MEDKDTQAQDVVIKKSIEKITKATELDQISEGIRRRVGNPNASEFKNIEKNQGK